MHVPWSEQLRLLPSHLSLVAVVLPLAVVSALAMANADGVEVTFRERPTNRHVVKYPGTIPASGPIELDGRLDEAGWQDALLASDFIRHQEAEGPISEPLLADREWERARYPTTCSLLHDDEFLYLGAEAAMPEGKQADPTYGVWPSPGEFDNTEFIGLILDRGKPFTYEERGHLTAWRAEYYIFVDWQGRVVDAHIPATWRPPDEEWSSGIEPRVRREGGRWTLEARIPLATLAGEDDPAQLRWLLTLARVTGDPRNGIPVRASSWTGTFLAKSLLRRVVLGDGAGGPRIVGLSLGEMPAGGGALIPAGDQQARAVIYSPTDGTEITLAHRLTAGGEQREAHRERAVLRRGLNQIAWEYAAPPGAFDTTVTLSERETEIDVREVHCEVAPPLLLHRRNWRASPPESIEACVEVGATGSALQTKSLRISLEGPAGPVAAQTLESPDEPIVDVAIPLHPLDPAPGTYELSAVLLEDGQAIAREMRAIQITEPPAATAEPGRIELTDTSLGELSGPYPVTTGVPLSRGLVSSVEALRLVDDADRTVEAEILPLGRWSRGGSLRWVRLNFRYDPRRTYFLEHNRGAGERPTALELEESGGEIRVRTGPLTLALAPDELGLQMLEVGGERVETRAAELYAVDEAGVRYSSRNGEARTEVEAAGPLRAVLKTTGSCRAEDGTELMRYVLRITAHAGERLLRVDPTFIFTTDMRLYRLRAMGLDLGVGLPGAGLQASAAGEMIDLGQRAPVEATQLFGDRYEVRGGSELLHSGEALDGLFHVAGDRLGCAVGVRRFRELCPLGLGRDGDGFLSLLMWPEGVPERWPAGEVDIDRIIHLPFPHQGPLLDFNIPREYQSVADTQGSKCQGYMWSGIWNANAMGLARTHSFALAFGGPEDGDPMAKARAFLAYPHVSASAEWMCGTEALGPMPMLPEGAAERHPVVPEAERALEEGFDRQSERLAEISLGKWNWGRLNQQYNASAERWNLWRVFMNTHNEAAEAPWMMFARTGDPKYLQFARAHTNHSVDVGWAHHADLGMRMKGYYGKIPGAVCDYKGYVPWSSGARLGYNWYVDYILLHYYLTGNARARDLAEQIYHTLLGMYHGDGGGRSGATRLETAIRLYYLTHDGRILPFISNHFQTKLDEQHEKGFVPGGTEFSEWLSGYHQLTGDPRAVEFGRRIAQADLAEPWWYGTGGKGWQPSWEVSAFAYNRTGNAEYLRPALDRLQRRIDGLAPWGATWSFLQSYAGYLLYAINEAGPGLQPLAPSRHLRSIDLRAETWTPLRAAQPGTGAKAVTFFLAGDIPEEATGQLRIVSQDETVLATEELPHLRWEELALSNPPIAPEIHTISAEVGDHPGPFRLEGVGDRRIRLLIPEGEPMFADAKFGQGLIVTRLSPPIHYPRQGNLNRDEGTIEVWFKPYWNSPAEREQERDHCYHYLFDSRDEKYQDGYQVYFWDSGKVGARKSLHGGGPVERFSHPVTWETPAWHHVAFTWKRRGDEVAARLFLDGEEVAARTGPAEEMPQALHDRITLGTNAPRTSNSFLNGIIDCVRTSDVARESFDLTTEPRADEHTLLLLEFDGTLKPRVGSAYEPLATFEP
ncbi:MAG: LamG-like jellyroll fold domain-containing protein [Armatimonadota bacterium]|nr:LamG-like jellyroll fold domain-containing protein [Armatimonadota bacterium]